MKQLKTVLEQRDHTIKQIHQKINEENTPGNISIQIIVQFHY